MGYELGDAILRALRSKFKEREDFAALEASESSDLFNDPFKVLAAVIISQNTTERNAIAAFERLEREVKVEPAKLVGAGAEAVAKAIAVAGLQRQKAKAMLDVSKLLLERYGGDVRGLLSLGEEAVRRELGSVKGVGEKTVDVLLAFSGFPVVPVDTHVRRVARRLGLAAGSSYRATRDSLHRVFREEVRLEAHLLLIKLGREICRARNSKCSECPLSNLCSSARVVT